MTKIVDEVQLDFCDVMFKPQPTTLGSRNEPDLIRVVQKFLHSPVSWSGIPIVAANMDTVGTYQMAKALAQQNMLTALHKHHDPKEKVEWFKGCHSQRTFYTLGIGDADYAKYKEFCEINAASPMMVCIDVANGYMDKFLKFIQMFRKENPSAVIMAGNVVTAEGVEAILNAGADIAKIGIGSGSVCLTRRVAGVGRPQLSAVLECAKAAHEMGGLICSDGGCVFPSDVAKAFGAGADFVMLGGMLAGHDESGGDVYREGTEKYMHFYGMSSTQAMDKYHDGVAPYRASEGRSLKIPYRGPVEKTVQEILGGVRSAMTYINARTIEEIPLNTTFYTANRQLNTSLGN